MQAIIVLFSNFVGFSYCLPAQLIIPPEGLRENEIVISGVDHLLTFTTAEVNFSCVCVTGLWAFYGQDEGRGPLIIGGEEEYCTPLSEKIYRITLLSAPSGEVNAYALSVFDRELVQLNSKLVYEAFSLETEWETWADVSSAVVLTVGRAPFTLSTTKTSFCLLPKIPADSSYYFYCIFEYPEPSKNKVTAQVTPYCDKDADVLEAKKCVPYQKGRGFCPKKEQEKEDLEKNNVKRSADDQRKLGRVFLSGSTAMKNYSFVDQNITEARDYSVLNSTHNGTSPHIKSELWNYIVQYAERISGIRQPKTMKYKKAAFRLLDMCKEISKASCPSSYVPKDFFDVIIGTFINVQSKVYDFKETFSDYPSERRIVDALSKCLRNFTEPYPFVQTNRSTPCNETVQIGAFDKYDKVLYLDVIENSTGISWEPVIDTAWQVFSHAHSACYEFFSAYNDHHLFISLVMPLFTNEVNDLWYRGEKALQNAERDIYGFAFGFMYDSVMHSSHCSAFARLESKYPWDLSRPGRTT